MNYEQLKSLNTKVKYPYSRASLEMLVGVHPMLQSFAFEMANVIDIKIVSGVRKDEEQMRLFDAGQSSKNGTTDRSNHQVKKDGFGHALDMLPLPRGVNMYLDDGSEDNIRWGQFDGLAHGIAYKLGMKIRTGFKWRSNMMDSLARNERDNTFPDGNHVEFVEE